MLRGVAVELEASSAFQQSSESLYRVSCGTSDAMMSVKERKKSGSLSMSSVTLWRRAALVKAAQILWNRGGSPHALHAL